ncbi:hypothetical protein D3C80_510610 [compost metagenome]
MQDDLAKDIQFGDLIKINVSNKGRDGIGVVAEVLEINGVLHVKSKRLLDRNNCITKSPKPGIPIEVAWVTKLNVEYVNKQYIAAVEHAEAVRNHLLANRGR